MRHEFARALIDGTVIMSQSFVTEKGTYKINIIRNNKYIYCMKYLNDNIVECRNLNKTRVTKVKKDEEV